MRYLSLLAVLVSMLCCGCSCDVREASAATGGEYEPWQFASVPDFLNLDLGPADSHLPDANAQHHAMAAYVLDTIAAEEPEFVLVPGDLVGGEWDHDWDNSEPFGPTSTTGQKHNAIISAADHYYPAWLQRFSSRGLEVVTTPGDHEFGDNAFPENLTDTYRRMYARYLGPPHHVFRHRNVAVISLDPFSQKSRGHPFDLFSRDETVGWVLGHMQLLCNDDTVDHVIVQGHVPFDGQVKTKSSSGLIHGRGLNSPLWEALTGPESCMRIYMAGEVHDWDVVTHDGKVQLTHGGLLARTDTHNYALVTVQKDHLDIEIKEAPQTYPNGEDPRLWQTGTPLPPEYYEIGEYQTVYTLTVP